VAPHDVDVERRVAEASDGDSKMPVPEESFRVVAITNIRFTAMEPSTTVLAMSGVNPIGLTVVSGLVRNIKAGVFRCRGTVVGK
jgi:hypothetical protein